MTVEHGGPRSAPAPTPLVAVPGVPRRTPAEEARTLMAGTNVATLATLSEDGGPWASLVTFGMLPDGAPVLFVSTLAEHGRNLQRDGRASLVVAQSSPSGDPLAAGRVTVAGKAHTPVGEQERTARTAYLTGVDEASTFIAFDDFSLYVVDVERVRWVGGYGRMDSVTAAEFAAAEPDPVGDARGAIAHLNDDHADALLVMAQALGGYPDATAARCTAADRYGLDLAVQTPRGSAPARVGFAEPVTDKAGLRQATVELTRRARATQSQL
jgi:putative heme iron utilization protein